MSEPFTPEQTEQLRVFVDLLGQANREADPSIKAKQEEAKRAKEAADRLKAMSETIQTSVLSSFGTFSKGLMSTEQGLNKFSGSITGITNTVGSLAGQFGFAGKVLGGFIKVIGEIAGASLKQNDDLMKSYQNLSDMGSVATGGLEGLANQLHRVGLVASEAEKFEKALKPVTGQMAMFGGAVTQGRDKMVEVMAGLIGPNNQFEVSLARLGYSTQDIREGAADFVQRQARLGLAQTKSTEQLRNESHKYMTTMKELQELTGMTRDEQQKAMDMQMADARMSIHLRGLKDDEARNLSQYLVLYEQRFGKEAAAGLKDRIVNDGRLTTDLAAGSYQSATTAYADAIQAQKKGVGQFADSLNNTADVVKRRMDTFGGTLMTSDSAMKDYGLTNELMNGALATNRSTTAGVTKQLKEMGEISANGSERLNQNIVNEQKMRAIRIMGDKALYEVGNLTVGMFTKLIDIGYKFAKFLATMIDKMSPYIPGMRSTNIAAQFRDMDDIQADKEKIAQSRADIEQRLVDSQRQLANTQEGNLYYALRIKQEQEKQEELKKKLTETQDKQEKVALETKIKNSQDEITKLKEQKEKVDKDSRVANENIAKAHRAEIERLKKDLEKLKDDENKVTEEEVEMAKKTVPGFGTMKADTGLKIAGSQGMTTDAGGKEVSKEKLAQRQAAAAELNKTSPERSQEILNKISFKNKAENTGGGDVDPALYGLAEKVNALFPGATFTAMNDVYHQVKRPNSRHTAGKALDFALGANAPRTPEEADAIKEKLKDIGASKVLDEYFRDKTDSTTGGHFHLEVARHGGLFSGPSNGYPVMLHGKESAWPEEKLKGMLAEVQKGSIEQYKNELMNELGLKKSTTATTTTPTNMDPEMMSKLYEMMEQKFNTMISRLETNNSLSEDILTYTKA
jgi:hypothetical protein